ncbi:OLC1v1005270C3 [Oldenlandia corymbosa var. corymbosa]|uniref:OLC1v1005270C3 n=1 Tax=Oldenlandia corymbosa var. corymbosa TaxID=529605 RepID=A0AAV1DFI4_OLDCO|nr:OLC1v1005270C3 [Oldenlandia corymbosa var. corymbosa]
MEFLGRRVKKEFEGKDTTSLGTVRSYDSCRGFFKIEYEDGYSEELELSEMITLLLKEDDGQQVGNSVSGKGNYCSDSASCGELDLNSSAGALDLNVYINSNERLDLNCVGKDVLDLNCMMVVDHEHFNSNVENKVAHAREDIIDLNMDVNNEGDYENVKVEVDLNERKGHCFDLNLGLDEEIKGFSECVVLDNHTKQSCSESVGRDPLKNDEANCVSGQVEMVDVKNTGDQQSILPMENNLIDGTASVTETTTPLSNGGFSTASGLEDEALGCALRKRRGRKRKVSLDTDTTSEAVTEFNHSNLVEIELKAPSCNDGIVAHFDSNADIVSGSALKGKRGRKRKMLLDTDTNSTAKSDLTGMKFVEIERKTPECNDGISTGFESNTDTVSGSVPKVRRGRKRKVPFDTDTNFSVETALRRSTRTARKSALLNQDSTSHPLVLSDTVNDLSLSPTASAVTEEKISERARHEISPEQNVLPPKLDLPPSSGNLNLGDMPVLDIFSVYSFLRSFSSLLFLSPFELEDFVSCLNCDAPSFLFDSIHVSLLNVLRNHLESLPDDSSESASHCLRCHDWDLLDMITWPVFMVDYLLTYSSGLKPGFDISGLKLFESDYYKQSPSVKIEILRSLCDDVIEVDYVKSEINRRSLVSEPFIDFDRDIKSENSKRRKTEMDIAASCVTGEDNEETVDWNSDECCLCKMDGNLICCDGCPAAFHSRCVGVISSHLPEGDWYCPECTICKDRPWMKMDRAMRGADLLGTDPYGQLYYSCCGYLLVLEDPHSEASFKYYIREDLHTVLEVLNSSVSVYYTIMSAIFKQWDLSFELNGANNAISREGVPVQLLAHSDAHPKATDIVTKDVGGEVSELGFVNSVTVDHVINLGHQNLSSEGSADGSQAITHNNGTAQSNWSSVHTLAADRRVTRRKFSAMSIPLAANGNDVAKRGHDLSLTNAGIRSPACSSGYVNFYSFAKTASEIADLLIKKSSNKESEDALKSVDDILSEQMKAISDKFAEFCWPKISNTHDDARKENCGWCFSCKVPEIERECLISSYTNGPSLENSTSECVSTRLKKNKKCHLIDVLCHLLCIEERLQGLLLGPWLNPHYSNYWRKTLLKVTAIAHVKSLLLKLESSLRPLALSADWTKHVDSDVSVGSAVHIVTTSLRGSSRNSIVRKRAKFPDLEPISAPNAASGLGLLWWRGGRLSRRLFNWKVLPRALASKAARQGGCKKIPGILYPDGSEFAKRSKFVAWKAGVELTKSVEQLALQVRDFDANIRWDDIENKNVMLKLVRESKKPLKSFKKAIVRRKCIEGTTVKYLLDFGKRRFIPDVVLKYGSKVEESDERKKFWLEEFHVPLHLLKGFEQKRLARMSNKVKFGKLPEHKSVVNPPPKRKGFSYLFSKAERLDYYQCGHCSKDVLIREAVSCQYCKGNLLLWKSYAFLTLYPFLFWKVANGGGSLRYSLSDD